MNLPTSAPIRLSVPVRPKRLGRDLTEAETRTLLAVADVLIPAAGPNPSASQAPDYHKWLTLALVSRLDAFESIARALATLGSEPDDDLLDRLRSLSEQDPDTFQVLSAVVAGAYLMVPEVKALIGYPGQRRDLPRLDEAIDDLEGGLMDPVIERGHFYTPAGD